MFQLKHPGPHEHEEERGATRHRPNLGQDIVEDRRLMMGGSAHGPEKDRERGEERVEKEGAPRPATRPVGEPADDRDEDWKLARGARP